eukprot:6206062-Pleurochrysis_carterae.AAC.1
MAAHTSFGEHSALHRPLADLEKRKGSHSERGHGYNRTTQARMCGADVMVSTEESSAAGGHSHTAFARGIRSLASYATSRPKSSVIHLPVVQLIIREGLCGGKSQVREWSPRGESA